MAERLIKKQSDQEYAIRVKREFIQKIEYGQKPLFVKIAAQFEDSEQRHQFERKVMIQNIRKGQLPSRDQIREHTKMLEQLQIES